MLRLSFAGTPAFAAASLAALLADRRFELVEVWTQPDRPAGRGRKTRPGAVAELAATHGIPLWQPENLLATEANGHLRTSASDVLVVVAFGRLLPGASLTTPPLGCVNIHASLLPRWRGAAPIQRAILAGDHETGVTIMRVVEELDAGPILLRRSCIINPEDTAGTLHDKLAELGAESIKDALLQLHAGTAHWQDQDPSQVTYAEKITKEDAAIDWQKDASYIARQVRAFNPAPVAYTNLRGFGLRIWKAVAVAETSGAAPGAIVKVGADGICVACGSGQLQITSLQPAGKKPMSAAAFINGYRSFSEGIGC
jgi:methionyl-tRNA formyltransferase